MHLRARRAMRAYEQDRPRRPRSGEPDAQRVLEQFLTCLSAGDVAGVQALLAPDVQALTDAAGEFHANVRPILGRDNVMAGLFGLAKRSSPLRRMEWKTVNGLPAVLVEREPMAGFASRFLMTADFDAEGRIRRLYSVLASGKLAGLFFRAIKEHGT